MSEPTPVWRNRIKAQREAQGISQAELARRVGLTRQYLSGLEAQKWEPRVALLLALARELGCTVDDLIEVEGSER